MKPTTDDIAKLVERHAGGKTARIVRLLMLAGYSLDEAHALLRSAYDAGVIELRPESGLHTLSPADALLCPRGPQDSVLSGIRRI